jgi:endoglucanase
MSTRILPICICLSSSATLIAASVAGCDSGTGSEQPSLTVAPTGCQTSSPPKTAPGGYYVNGNSLCTPDGRPHLIHGVDRPSLEWSATGDRISPSDFAMMKSWNANTVRIAMNQDFWLSDSPTHDPGYQDRIARTVTWAEEAGLDVILDLHWSDKGDYTVKPAQQVMADAHSIQFWQQVAERFKGDGRVFFELYNEPHDIPVDVWLHGGLAAGFNVAGMQQLHDAIRAAGADNPVLVGGLDFAYNLQYVAQNPVQGYNILYATHPYNNADEKKPPQWFPYWGYLTQTAPVVITEFGDGCNTDYDQQLIAFADQRNAGWTAWAWYVGGCSFPSLLSDWSSLTPTANGAVVKNALAAYGSKDPPAQPPLDAGLDDAAPDVDVGSEAGAMPDAQSPDGGSDADMDADTPD